MGAQCLRGPDDEFQAKQNAVCRSCGEEVDRHFPICVRCGGEKEMRRPNPQVVSVPFSCRPPGQPALQALPLRLAEAEDPPSLPAEGACSLSSRSREGRRGQPLLDRPTDEEEDSEVSTERTASRKRRGKPGGWPLGPGERPLLAPAPPLMWGSKTLQEPAPVFLHVYDIGTSGAGRAINNLLRPLGTGIFHCGVEVYGCEWSYSDTTTGDGDGVFCSVPRCCSGYSYIESISMGSTATTEVEVLRLVDILKKDWPVNSYDILARNCCHFSDEFCQRLGAGSIPSWVTSLAGAGAAVAAAGDTTCCRMVATQATLAAPCCHPAELVHAPGAHVMPIEVITVARRGKRAISGP